LLTPSKIWIASPTQRKAIGAKAVNQNDSICPDRVMIHRCAVEGRRRSLGTRFRRHHPPSRLRQMDRVGAKSFNSSHDQRDHLINIRPRPEPPLSGVTRHFDKCRFVVGHGAILSSLASRRWEVATAIACRQSEPVHSSFQPATLPRLDIKRFQVSGTVNKPPMAKADHVCLGLDFHDITPPYISQLPSISKSRA